MIHHTPHHRYRNKMKTDDPNIVLFPTPPRLGRSSGPPPPRLASTQTGETAFLGKEIMYQHNDFVLASNKLFVVWLLSSATVKQLSKISSGQNDGFPQYPNWKNCSNFQIQGGMIDLLQLECLTGLEEANKLAENPIVQVRKERYLWLVLLGYVCEKRKNVLL